MMRIAEVRERFEVLGWLVLAVGLCGFGVCLQGQVPATPAPAPVAPAAQVAPPAAATPTAKAAAPMTAVPQADCVTSECHAGIKKHKVVHGPVNVNACDACHKLDDAKTHRFSMAREKADACTFCHQVDTKDMPFVHKPVQTGECTGCHNPHGGMTRKLLRGGSMNQMCNQCHQDVMANKKSVHGPVAAGACDSCHTPHASKVAKLLVADGKELCFFCHKEMQRQMKSAKIRHSPVTDSDCGKCHDPHASDFPKQTRMAPLQLCTSCHEHEKLLKSATAATYKHSVVTDKDSCLNCHTAHGGQLAWLLKKEPLKLCMECHSKSIRQPGGKSIAALTEVTDTKTRKHGPIRDGSCSGCHEPHGSETRMLLAKSYPEPFYQPFALDEYALCFSCHDSQLVLNKDAGGLTNFRNGDENLHFLHVNREKGRNCRSCHSTHASVNEMHVRNTVPFGKWEMPITYTKTASGGGCAPGCHQPFKYDRETPAVYDAAAPADTTPVTPSSGSGGAEAKPQ